MAGSLGDCQCKEVLHERLVVAAELRLVGTLIENGLCFPQFALDDSPYRTRQID
jgi:hypothetical protein